MCYRVKKLFKDGFKVSMVRTDRGIEFRSKEVTAYLKSQNVHHFYALNTETKTNYAERLIKTIKHNLFRYMMITRIDVYETLCPQQMLVHKGGKIKNLGGECRDVTPTKSLSQNIRVDVNREVKFL